MGSYLDYRCPHCRFAVRVGGPEEFFVAPDGERRVYGHPEPSSAEAADRGVDGFWMDLWCANCSALKRMITMQFEKPCDALDAWTGRGVALPGFPADASSCPDCAADLVDELPGSPPTCPSCHAGPLECGKLLG